MDKARQGVGNRSEGPYIGREALALSATSTTLISAGGAWLCGGNFVMKTVSKFLRGTCAIATSGALVLSSLAATAQGLPPQDAQQPPPSDVQQPPPPGAQQPPPPVMAPSSPTAQQPGQPAGQQLGQGELEKLLAPIALYPDDLVGQILTASTYPIEVVEAERWVGEHTNVHGDALQDAMLQQSWDPSVKGLTSVPQVLSMMNDKLDWTQQLGEAFLAQPNDVSNAIQQLRAKAQATGSLKSSQELNVTTVAADTPPPPPAPPPPGVDPSMLPPPPPADYISIEPTDPGLYYVPIYDPTLVYGPWVWPDYEPFYWYPPGYVVGAAVIGFGVGFFVGSALWCHYNWHGGGVSINVVQFNQFNHTNIVASRNGFANWQFNAAHRGTVGFQNASLRQQFGGPQGIHGPLNGGMQGGFQGSHTLLSHTGTGSLNTNAGIHSPLNGGIQGIHGPQNGMQGGLQGTHTLSLSHTGTGSLNTNAGIHTPLNGGMQGGPQGTHTLSLTHSATSPSASANIHTNVNGNNRSVNTNFKPGGRNFKPAFAHNVGRPPPGGGGKHH